MGRVRRIAALAALTICALLAFEILAPSPGSWSGLFIGVALRDREAADDQPAPREPIRRVALSGYYYGMCDGVLSAVLLVPEPCRALWRERLILLARAPD